MTAPSRRDRSRTAESQTIKLVKKHTQPPRDQGGWMGISRDLLESPAFRSLSRNAFKALFRIMIEHIGHNRLHNGQLIVTHNQLIDFGVTGEYVADALDELQFKGLLSVKRGRAGAGTAHPNRYRLTFDGGADGTAATNEWRSVTEERVRDWQERVRKFQADARSKKAGKSKSSLRHSEVRPLRHSEVRRAG